jgi:hypothetical protein
MPLSHDKKKLGKKKRFLNDHPYCCFCGGTEESATIDHVPPKACFPDGYWPEEFEFPACEACNQGSKRDDQLFGFYSQLLDFNESNRTPEDNAKMTKLRDAIARNYPEALPDVSTARPIHQVGSIITPYPVAISMQRPSTFQKPMETLQRKLTHALYYRETGRPLTTAHLFQKGYYQIQGNDTTLTKYFNELLPNQTIGGRSNIPKNYGERFTYKSGFKEQEDFFVYAAQFGRGLIVFGIVLGPSLIDQIQHDQSRPLQFAGCRETKIWCHDTRLLNDAHPLLDT